LKYRSRLIDKLGVESHFDAVRTYGPIHVLMRALFFALVGVVLVSGTAFAHGAVTESASDWSDQHAQLQVRHHNAAPIKDLAVQVASEQGQHTAGPCSGESSGGHFGDSCCNIACHAALTTPLVEPAGTTESPRHYLATVSDMLVGRPGDRSERPPKRD